MTPCIVAEISKTWLNGASSTPLLCQSFERVIEVNRSRGYRLHSFALHQLIVSRADQYRDDEMVETIIAVFEATGAPTTPAAVDPVDHSGAERRTRA